MNPAKMVLRARYEAIPDFALIILQFASVRRNTNVRPDEYALGDREIRSIEP